MKTKVLYEARHLSVCLDEAKEVQDAAEASKDAMHVDEPQEESKQLEEETAQQAGTVEPEPMEEAQSEVSELDKELDSIGV